MHRQSCCAAVLLAACLTLTTVPASGGDWPRFRGPNGTGTVDDRDVPVRWSAAEGVLWRTPLPGSGNSSPIVCAGRVFVQTASRDGSERSLVCINAVSGKILWSKAVPGKRAHIHNRNTLASGTPASDGERVYLAVWDGKDLSLVAYDFNGELAWSHDLGPFVSQHGAGHSPIVQDGRVFIADDQDRSAVLLAFDARSGKPLWRVERKAYRACYSTPFVRLTPAGPELVVGSTGGVDAYDPQTGNAIWHCDWSFARMPLRTVASPVAGAGLVFANAGDGDGSRDTIALRPGGNGSGSKGAVVWQDRKSFPYVPCMLTQGDYLFTVTDAGVAACHRALTGERVWSERLGSPVTASPVLVNGRVYATGEDGQVYVFAASTTYKLLAKNALGEPVAATPAVADGRLYFRGNENLICIGKVPAQ
jgi:outer membrane protein assembly factor BamB